MHGKISRFKDFGVAFYFFFLIKYVMKTGIKQEDQASSQGYKETQSRLFGVFGESRVCPINLDHFL